MFTKNVPKEELLSRSSHHSLKGQKMFLMLKEILLRRKVDDQTFFRAAYQWCFGKDCDVSNDVAQFKLHAIVPRYVERYILHCQEELM